MDNIKYNNFQNICRTCMITSELESIQDNNIIDVLDCLTGIQYSKTDELPHQICLKCIQKLNGIHKFALQCKESYLRLVERLVDFKNNQNILLINESINNNQVESIQIKQELIDDTKNQDEFKTENIPDFEQVQLIPNTYVKPEINDEPTIIPNVPLSGKQEIETKTKKKIHKCSICSKTFFDSSGLLIHNSVHSDQRPFVCGVCSKSFKRSGDLVRHKRLHSGEKPYQCSICSKSFPSAGSLTVHKHIHSTERQYKCDLCPKAFNYTYNLKQHQLTHSGVRPYDCKTCTKTFASLSALAKHTRIHNGERRYKCDICNKGFNHSNSLKTHLLVHSGQRPFNCDVCSKKFYDNSSLVRHKRLHIDARPYQCEVCNKAFSRMSSAVRHKQVHTDQGLFETY